MRKYEITNDAGDVLRIAEAEDTFRPTLLAGESFRLTHVDGEPAIPGEPLLLTAEERETLPDLASVEIVEAIKPAPEVSAEPVSEHHEPPATPDDHQL